MEKAQELETILSDLLLDLTSANGVHVEAVPEIPKIPVLETRAALMTVLISLVFLPISS